MKWNHTIWEDGKKDEAINIIAEDGIKALDLAAQHYGYVDYADMAQEKNWDEDEGLNMTTPDEPCQDDKLNTQQIHQVMSANHQQYLVDWDNDNAAMDLRTYVSYELYNNPEGFDCFFSRSWDEIDTDEQEQRKLDIIKAFAE